MTRRWIAVAQDALIQAMKELDIEEDGDRASFEDCLAAARLLGRVAERAADAELAAERERPPPRLSHAA